MAGELRDSNGPFTVLGQLPLSYIRRSRQPGVCQEVVTSTQCLVCKVFPTSSILLFYQRERKKKLEDQPESSALKVAVSLRHNAKLPGSCTDAQLSPQFLHAPDNSTQKPPPN